MTGLLLSVAPGFDSPLEMLEACHERFLSQLETLDRLARWLPDHGSDEHARKAAATVIHFFDVAAVHHHLDEERELFPVLLERVGSDRRITLVSLIEWIKEDHQRMFAAWEAMRARLVLITAGEPAELTLAQVHNFTERYVMHIEREEGEMFPFARELLAESDIARVGATMSARRNPSVR